MAQTHQFKPKIDFFSIPNLEITTDEITDIQTDNDGYVWVISFSSIYKYNGSVFKKVRSNNTNHRTFLRFFETKGNEKFVNDYLGNIFFIEGDSLRAYEYNSLLRKLQLNRGFTGLRFDEEKNLHVAYDNSGYTIIKKDGSIEKPTKGKDLMDRGVGCILSQGKTPFIFKNTLSLNLEKRDTTPSVFRLLNENFETIDTIVYVGFQTFAPISLVALPNGNYLFSNGRGSLIEFNNKRVISMRYYPDNIIRLFVDRQKNLWISTMYNGIHFYPGSILNEENKTVFLENSFAFVSTQDYQGGLWIYSAKRGLGYLPRLDVEYLSRGQNLSKHTIDIKGSKLFFSVENEVFEYDEKLNRSRSFFKTDHRNIAALHYDSIKEELWVSSRGRLSAYKGGNEKIIDPSPLYDWSVGGQIEVQSFPGKDSVLAITKQEYFYCVDYKITHTSEIFSKSMISLVKEKDTLWVNNINGLYKITPQGRKFLGEEFELANNHAKNLILFQEEKLLSFSSKGIFSFNGNSFKEIKFNETSLLNCQLISENDSVVWAISTGGCFSIKKNNSGYLVEAFRHLPRVAIDKLASNERTLYFTANNGEVGRISFDQIRRYPLVKPKVIISKVEALDSIFTGNNNNKLIELDYDKRNIRFSFESLDYQNLNLFYRYKLDGYDKKWLSTYTNLINYVSLPAGDYSFKVQSKFGLGEWGEEEVFAFSVLAPFWQKSWFIFGVIFFSLIVFYQVIAFRFHSIQRKQLLEVKQLRLEQKALRAQMAPHYIFNVIASLKYLIVEETREKANRFLDLFAGSLRNVLDQANSNYITINNEIGFMSEYLEMERFRLEETFDYELKKEVQDSNKFIPPFMVQPFVENAIQHGLKRKGKGGKLLIVFEQETNYLKVTIKDNGIGREKANEFKRKKKKRSYGINLIEKRLAIHNLTRQKIQITDLYDENKLPLGTEVVMYIRFIDSDQITNQNAKPNERNDY